MIHPRGGGLNQSDPIEVSDPSSDLCFVSFLLGSDQADKGDRCGARDRFGKKERDAVLNVVESNDRLKWCRWQ